MKLKQKEAYVYDVLKNLAVSKTFLGVIICEIVSAISTFFKVFIPQANPAYSNNQIINTLLIIITALCVLSYSILTVVCYINIYSFLKGKTDKFFGLKHLYKVQFWGIMLSTACVTLFPIFKMVFNLLNIFILLFLFSCTAIIIFLIYSTLVKNAIECAEFAANGFFRGKIGIGLVIYVVVILIFQLYSVITGSIFVSYESLLIWLKMFIGNFDSICGSISLVLYLNLLLRFRKAMNA